MVWENVLAVYAYLVASEFLAVTLEEIRTHSERKFGDTYS